MTQWWRAGTPMRSGYVIALNRPEKRNALSAGLVAQLCPLSLGEAGADPAVRVIALSGESGRDFCAGADLEEVAASRSRGTGGRIGGCPAPGGAIRGDPAP